MENNQIIYPLESSGNKEAILKNTANDVMAKLQNRFGSSYSVTADDFGVFDKDWTHRIKIRKGDKIGAEVVFKWEKSNPSSILVEVDESSKMGSMITYGSLLIFMGIGAYMGYADVEPLAFLPGSKIAAGLGGLIGAIPGAIVGYLLKSALMKNEKEENKQLVNDVINICKNE